jgi:tetraprenyl-beta-curcumene synthase
LVVAVQPPASHPDYYAEHQSSADGEYLCALVDTARSAFQRLPSRAATAAGACRAAQRIANYQALHHAKSHEALAIWSDAEAPAGANLLWWETSAATASSLPALAMIAAASNPHLDANDAVALEAAYWPWASALHTLLDCLIDLPEDIASGQPSLLSYANTKQIAARMQDLVTQTSRRMQRLPQPHQHAILIVGMTSLYLTAPEAYLPIARPITEGILAEIGSIAWPALAIMRLRRATIRRRKQSNDNVDGHAP